MKLFKLTNGDIISQDIYQGYYSRKQGIEEVPISNQGTMVMCSYSELMRASNYNSAPAMVLCNDITKLFYNPYNPEIFNGSDYIEEDGEEYEIEVFQYYIIPYSMAQWLKKHTDQLIYCIDELDMYILGVTHYGTNWDYVTTTFIV